MINSQRRFLRKYKRDDTNLLPTFDGRFSFSFSFLRGEGKKEGMFMLRWLLSYD